jgi:NAD(P)-dependent dehydrogenase (short-subunit alcohol dehydrogenase family)
VKETVALITGGASGIGLATALRFAEECPHIAIVDISEANGKKAVQLLQERNCDAVFIKCDVSKSEEVQSMIDGVVDKYGRIDFAVNNAGVVGRLNLIHEYPEDEWHQMIGVHLTGVFLCMKYEIPHMLKNGFGVIVNTASTAGLLGVPTHSAYVAAKHGILGLTKSAALEYGKQGIRVNAVCPGPIRTPMLNRLVEKHPEYEQWYMSNALGRIADVKEMAAAIFMLCTDSASFITGHALRVDGGLTP